MRNGFLFAPSSIRSSWLHLAAPLDPVLPRLYVYVVMGLEIKIEYCSM